jgi:hypothetical protein
MSSTPELATPDSEDEVRKHAIASLKRKRRFHSNVVLYIAVNSVLWLIWVLTDRSDDGSIPWPPGSQRSGAFCS